MQVGVEATSAEEPAAPLAEEAATAQYLVPVASPVNAKFWSEPVAATSFVVVPTAAAQKLFFTVSSAEAALGSMFTRSVPLEARADTVKPVAVGVVIITEVGSAPVQARVGVVNAPLLHEYCADPPPVVSPGAHWMVHEAELNKVAPAVHVPAT